MKCEKDKGRQGEREGLIQYVHLAKESIYEINCKF